MRTNNFSTGNLREEGSPTVAIATRAPHREEQLELLLGRVVEDYDRAVEKSDRDTSLPVEKTVPPTNGLPVEKIALPTEPLPVEKHQTGTLFPYTKQATTKDGHFTYPKVEERDTSLPAYRRKIDHWYWSFRFERKLKGQWKQKNLHVPRRLVPAVRAAVDEGWPYWRTCKEILNKEV